MTPDHRRAFARCLRSLSTEDAAVQLLEAYEAQLDADAHDEASTAELRALEQLPDWSHPTLMQWAMSAPEPPGFPGMYDASALVVLREAQLLGMLAKAVEQAISIRDSNTMHRIVQTMARTWVRVRGEQILREAFDSEES